MSLTKKDSMRISWFLLLITTYLSTSMAFENEKRLPKIEEYGCVPTLYQEIINSSSSPAQAIAGFVEINCELYAGLSETIFCKELIYRFPLLIDFLLSKLTQLYEYKEHIIINTPTIITEMYAHHDIPFDCNNDDINKAFASVVPDLLSDSTLMNIRLLAAAALDQEICQALDSETLKKLSTLKDKKELQTARYSTHKDCPGNNTLIMWALKSNNISFFNLLIKTELLESHDASIILQYLEQQKNDTPQSNTTEGLNSDICEILELLHNYFNKLP